MIQHCSIHNELNRNMAHNLSNNSHQWMEASPCVSWMPKRLCCGLALRSDQLIGSYIFHKVTSEMHSNTYGSSIKISHYNLPWTLGIFFIQNALWFLYRIKRVNGITTWTRFNIHGFLSLKHSKPTVYTGCHRKLGGLWVRYVDSSA